MTQDDKWDSSNRRRNAAPGETSKTRRGYLGLLVVTPVTGSEVAHGVLQSPGLISQNLPTGYGEGGYGEMVYGGLSDVVTPTPTPSPDDPRPTPTPLDPTPTPTPDDDGGLLIPGIVATAITVTSAGYLLKRWIDQRVDDED